ncbi:MAG: hypothetical protein K2L72_04830, partial [Clostridia bacterium]|nr:hypothetical protein [Clostridia bacterium]
MNRLFIANLMRIKNSKLYWIICGSMAAVALVLVFIFMNADKTVDQIITLFVIPVGIALAVFLGLFFGTEYGDGTIRNKLIALDRRQIYFANLFTSFICAIGLIISYMLPVVLIGFPCIGLPKSLSFRIVAVGFVTLLAYCSIFTMIGMLYSNKAGATVLDIILFIVLLLIGAFICSVLMEPEFVLSYGDAQFIPNPRYVTGTKRVILQILANVLPSGQAIQFAEGVTDTLWSLPLYSL